MSWNLVESLFKEDLVPLFENEIWENIFQLLEDYVVSYRSVLNKIKGIVIEYFRQKRGKCFVDEFFLKVAENQEIGQYKEYLEQKQLIRDGIKIIREILD